MSLSDSRSAELFGPALKSLVAAFTLPGAPMTGSTAVGKALINGVTLEFVDIGAGKDDTQALLDAQLGLQLQVKNTQGSLL